MLYADMCLRVTATTTTTTTTTAATTTTTSKITRSPPFPPFENAMAIDSCDCPKFHAMSISSLCANVFFYVSI